MNDEGVKLDIGDQAWVVFRPVRQGKEQVAETLGDLPGHKGRQVLRDSGVHIECGPQIVKNPFKGEDRFSKKHEIGREDNSFKCELFQERERFFDQGQAVKLGRAQHAQDQAAELLPLQGAVHESANSQGFDGAADTDQVFF